MTMTQIQMAGHLGAGLACGAAIGLERQWRARLAGLRTNALVALGSSLSVLLSMYGFMSNANSAAYDGSRVAAQIVSGTLGVVGANLLLRPLGRRLDRQPNGGAEVATDYHFEAVCPEPDEAHLRALVVPP